MTNCRLPTQVARRGCLVAFWNDFVNSHKGCADAD